MRQRKWHHAWQRGRRRWRRAWRHTWGHKQKSWHWWPAQPLTELPIGRVAMVTDILSKRESRLARLSTFGLVPGSFVTLEQRYPAYVVRVGETEVTLDTEVAREIIVEMV